MEFKAIKFMERAEGRKSRVYLDSSGLPTIGIGHLLTRSELLSGKIIIHEEGIRWVDGLTDVQIDALLLQDLATANRCVNGLVKVLLTQNQHDALVSFAFNVGSGAFYDSTLLRLLNQGGFSQVPTQLRRWNRSGGRIVPGLVNRREAEISLWNTPDEEAQS